MKKKSKESPHKLEIATMKAAIKYIKVGWGANCKEEFLEFCMSCEARRVIKFLKTHIEVTE